MKRILPITIQICFLSLCLALLVTCTSPAAYVQKGASTKKMKEYVPIFKEKGELDIPASKMITLPYTEASYPIIIGQDMYMAVNTQWGYLPDEVRKINLHTKKETTIFKTEHYPSTINDLQWNGGEWLIWVDSTQDGYDHNIWVKNLKTGEMKKIYQQPEYSYIFIMPVLYDHYVAWTDEKMGKIVTVRLMDLDTGKAEDIAQYHTFSFANCVDVDPTKGRLIWNDSANGVGLFKVFDFKTRQTTTYPLPGYTPGYSELVGDDHILFLNSKDNFTTWINPPVCIYHLKTKQYQTLSDDANNHDFEVAGDRIFYIDNEGVQSLLLKNGQLKKKKVPHQLQDPQLMHTPNHHLILQKDNDKDGKSISTTFEIIDLATEPSSTHRRNTTKYILTLTGPKKYPPPFWER
jgi:hypothetical protein